MHGYTLIFADIIAASDLAILLDFDGTEQWVPRSVMVDGDDLSEFSEVSEFWIKNWFCEKEELV